MMIEENFLHIVCREFTGKLSDIFHFFLIFLNFRDTIETYVFYAYLQFVETEFLGEFRHEKCPP